MLNPTVSYQMEKTVILVIPNIPVHLRKRALEEQERNGEA